MLTRKIYRARKYRDDMNIMMVLLDMENERVKISISRQAH